MVCAKIAFMKSSVPWFQPSYYMQAQLGRVSVLQATSTNSTDSSTDANLSITAARRLHTLLNCLMWQINLLLKPFYLTVTIFYIVSYLTIKYQSLCYLRSRTHNLTLTSKSFFYDNCNFITRARILFNRPIDLF